MQTFWQDLLYGLRTFQQHPGFVSAAVLTLALGVSVNTMMFSVVNGVLLADLPYQDPGRLILVRVSVDGARSLPSVSPPEVLDFEERTQIFDQVSAIRDGSAALTGEGDPEQIQMGNIRWNFLATLGVRPLLGHLFSAEDVPSQGPANTAVISYGFWQRRFGSDPGVIGRAIQLNGTSTTVIGVLPQEAQLLLPREAGLPRDLEAYAPLGFNFRNAPRFRWMRGVGRLKAGVSEAQAQEAMDALAADLIREVPAYQQQPFRYEVAPLHRDLVRTVRTPLLVLFGAVVFVLLIACANVANLLLARAAGREQEISVRTALGASRGRIVRQMLTESVALAIAGGILGLLLANWGLDLLTRFAPPSVPRLDNVALDHRVLLFTAAAAFLTVLLFGTVPAWQASRANLGDALKSGARTAGSSEKLHLRRLLVAGEIALSMVLLAGAGLMIRSFVALQQTRPGFNPDQLLTFQIALPFQRYRTPQDVSRFYQKYAQRVEGLPGVEAVGGSFPLPMSGRFWTNEYAYNEETERNWGSLESDNHVILPGTFASMGARLLAGRDFSWNDNAEGRKLIIVDEHLAQKAWPGENPVGKHLKALMPGGSHEPLEVIGVVEHIRQDHPGADGREQTYMLESAWPQWGMPLTVRTSLPAEQVMAAVKQEVAALDPDLALFKVRTMRGYVGEVVANNRLAMLLLSVFSALAVTLAVVGLYGTLAYMVTQRRQEFGVRIALGARPRDILRLVVGQGLRLTAAGIAIGLPASLGLSRLLLSLLYGVSPADPATHAAITALLVVVALLACYLPALRATRVEPAVALRCE